MRLPLDSLAVRAPVGALLVALERVRCQSVFQTAVPALTSPVQRAPDIRSARVLPTRGEMLRDQSGPGSLSRNTIAA
jgi:hypothetical protein